MDHRLSAMPEPPEERQGPQKVTESMLTSDPRTQLGLWTPKRAALRFGTSEIEGRDVRRFDTGKRLSFAEIKAHAS